MVNEPKYEPQKNAVFLHMNGISKNNYSHYHERLFIVSNGRDTSMSIFVHII